MKNITRLLDSLSNHYGNFLSDLIKRSVNLFSREKEILNIGSEIFVQSINVCVKNSFCQINQIFCSSTQQNPQLTLCLPNFSSRKISKKFHKF